MVLVGLDDTDSLSGGCTTHLVLELLRRLPGVDLIGPPRLVRLNPNIRHKTRGNGALALELAHGCRPARRVGWDGDATLWCYDSGEPLTSAEEDRVFDVARRLVATRARLEDSHTNPGLVLLQTAPTSDVYYAAVRRYVGLNEATALLGASGARWHGWKTGRGLVGATAATAWPGRRGTYEWILYRDPQAWGTPRRLDPQLGPTLDRIHPTTFDNYDPRTEHLRIAPASPCPILAGVRGTDPADLEGAARRVGPEHAAAGLLFSTNQATDDHLVARRVRDLRPYESASVVATVLQAPASRPGGHVLVRVADDSGPLDLAAFEPTKEFRNAVRTLQSGDVVRAHGGLHEDVTLLAMEKFELLSTSPRIETTAPACSACGKAMRSRGRAAGYRCDRCRTRTNRPHVRQAPSPPVAAHEVPIRVRRHLARPLRLKRLAEPVMRAQPL